MCGDITRHDRPRPDHGPTPDREARQDGGIRTQRTTAANQDLKIRLWLPSAPRSLVVGKHDTWPYENIVLNDYSVPKRDTTFDGDPVADLNLSLNKSTIAYVAIPPNHCPRQHMRKSPNARASTNSRAWFYQRMRVLEVVTHARRKAMRVP